MSDYTSANIGTLKYVPAGTFQRGSTPANTISVTAFRMSLHEITREQYLAIM
ncbi:MAG: formylglycine-generating enzyme family protein [Candidatus Riflebacteria bacterium]|nr:formylglycine-generating enzyme family protein [Candidatus Riflebacteria bacterium]